MTTGLIGDGARVTRDVPDAVRALCSFPDIDYADRFTVATGARATPERWARTMFGHVPGPGARFIWRGLLGLRLTRGRSPSTVGGWRIGGRGDDWIRLETASCFLTACMVVETGDGEVSWATFLRYDNRLGALVWPPLSAVHRRLVPGVLRGAARRLGRS